MQSGSDVSATDNELWESLKQGSEHAFERIYQRHVRALYEIFGYRRVVAGYFGYGEFAGCQQIGNNGSLTFLRLSVIGTA